MPDLLPGDCLKGTRIAIGVSESPDLDRLGLLEDHFRQALAEIARAVLVSGGTLAYGGHLDPKGYTTFLVQELQKYGRLDSPLLICLAWQEHRRVKLSDLLTQQDDLGMMGQIVCLDPDGNPIAPGHDRGEDPVAVEDPALRARALTAMRRYLALHTKARVLLGGRRAGFQGRVPGLMEEALESLDHNQPLYLAGGFGGVTADIAHALKADDGAWLPRRDDAPPDDPRLLAGLAELEARAAVPGWIGLGNGLTDAENRQLAATHRPGGIAELVALGLGRAAQRLAGAG